MFLFTTNIISTILRFMCRVSSVAGGGTVGPNGIVLPPNNVFSPEYDDPANIEDEYGYNSPNRRGSLGRRSIGK